MSDDVVKLPIDSDRLAALVADYARAYKPVPFGDWLSLSDEARAAMVRGGQDVTTERILAMAGAVHGEVAGLVEGRGLAEEPVYAELGQVMARALRRRHG